MDESKPNGEDENLLAGAGDAGNSTSTMQQVECDGNEESTGMHIVTEDDDSDEYTSLSEDDEDGSIAATHNQGTVAQPKYRYKILVNNCSCKSEHFT